MPSLDLFVFAIIAVMVALIGYFVGKGRRHQPKDEVFLTSYTGTSLYQPDLGDLPLTYENIKSRIGLAVLETLLGHTFVPGRSFWMQNVTFCNQKNDPEDRRKGEAVQEIYEIRNIEIVDSRLSLFCISYSMCGTGLYKEKVVKGFMSLIALATGNLGGFRFRELDRLDMEEYGAIQNTHLWGREYKDGPHFQRFHYGASVEQGTGEEQSPGVAVRIDGRMKMYRDVLEGQPDLVRERFFRWRLIHFEPSKL